MARMRLDAIAIIRKVWEIYGKYSAVQLSNMMHAPGTPWDQVTKNMTERFRNTKSSLMNLIRDCFKPKEKPA